MGIFVKKLREGNNLAFTELYRLYSRKLYAFCYRFLASDVLANEIVHDVFVAIWERRASLDSEKSFESYLFAIAKNKVIDAIKASVKEAEFRKEFGSTLSQIAHMEDASTVNEIKKIEEETVANFPPQRKLVYKLSREEYLSYDEIAQRLGISKNSVKTHLKLALKELREKIEPITNISFTLLTFWEIYF